MDKVKSSKQMKLLEPNVRQTAIDLVNKARMFSQNAEKTSTASGHAAVEWTALDIVTIHMVLDETDLVEPKRSFKPMLAHQIFGQKEKMHGYLFPKIQLYFLGNSAKCYLKFTHEGVSSNSDTDSVNIKIFDNLINWLPEDYVTDESLFIQALQNEDHTKMFGNKLMECELHNYMTNSNVKFIIRECPLTDPGFIEFHSRFECLIVWYIDAASQLDLEDPNWMLLYVYEEVCMPQTKKPGYYPIGYCAVYKFFHYPDKVRARISQCFVLPNCQRMGVGHKLLSATYQAVYNLPNAVDITVEDPCPAFQKLRDIVDSTLLKGLDCFKYPQITKGFTSKMFEEANNRYKINKRQCRRVYHILRMGYALCNDEIEEDDILINDIRYYLGILQQPTTSKNVQTNGIVEEVNHAGEHQIKIITAIEKYTSDIRPIAWRISELLKRERSGLL